MGINHAHICDFKNVLCPLRVLEVSKGSRSGKDLNILLTKLHGVTTVGGYPGCHKLFSRAHASQAAQGT